MILFTDFFPLSPLLPPYTLHPTPYTLHPTPYTLHPTLSPLSPSPYTLHPTPYSFPPYALTANMAEVSYIGRILDREKQAPISGAKVSIDIPGSPLIVHTDLEGIYKFQLNFGNSSVLEGEITIEAKGYKTYHAFIRLSPKNKDLGDIRLEHPSYQNSEVSSDSNNLLPIVIAITVILVLIVAATTLPSPNQTPLYEAPPYETPSYEIPDNDTNFLE